MFLNSSEASIEFMTPVDLNITPSEGTHNLFNCFIASVPKHEILKHCIDYIVHNVENNIIPSSILDFSGPGCLGKATNKYLNVDELTSFVGKEGIHNNFHFLKFEYGTEYVKDTNNNILFLSDIHLPYHDINALTLALDYGKSKEVNTIYLNGDIMDFYQVSFHEKDPSQRNIEYEFDTMRSFLDLLKKNLPQCKIFYKEGNHESRWERYLRQNAAAVSTMKEFRLDVLLNLRERGVEFIRNKQLVQAGKLNMIHGNEYKGGGGINVARTLWLRAGDNVIAGDKHKTQSGLKTNIDKSIVGTWSVGCLCDTNMDYLPFNEHNLGFAHIIVEPNGMFQVKNYSIINGKIV